MPRPAIAVRSTIALFFAITLILTAAMPAQAQQGPPPVDVATPLLSKIVDWDEYTGRFEAVERVELRARVSGYLQEVSFRDGQLVKKGDVLFVIDQRPFKAAYARVDAELKAALADQTLTVAELRRSERLRKNRNISESVVDERRAAKLRADAQVAIAKAALREVALDLEFTKVTAPFTGRISATQVDVGNLVTTGETLLATIVSTDPIRLVFTASEADFLKYSRLFLAGDRPSSRTTANPVEARLLDETGWPHKGRMDFVNNEIDASAGTITARAIFPNPDDLLTPGLFARLRLLGSGEYEALLIPDAAILADQARKIVMTVGKDGIVIPKVIRLGPLFRGLRVIRAGLSPEDRVIVSGLQRARPGGKVTPQETRVSFPEPAVN